MAITKKECALEFSFRPAQLAKLLKSNPSAIIVKLQLGAGTYTITARAEHAALAKNALVAENSAATALTIQGCPSPPGCPPA